MCTALQVTVTRSQLLKGKQKVDKTFEPVKVNIHSQATYDRVLSKCIAAAWKEEKVENVSYTLTDTGGRKQGQPHKVTPDQQLLYHP